MRYRTRVLGLLFLLSAITYLDRVAIAVAGPEMQAELGLSPTQWGWVLGIFALSYAVFEVPTGSLGDRIGPRRVLTRIVVWWSAFTMLTGAVSNFFALLSVRFAFGAGEAGAYPNASATIMRWFPVAERGRAHGIVWMASRVGGALTPLLVVPIVALYGWRAAFYTFGAVGLVWAVAWYWWFRDLPADMPGVTDAELAEIGPASVRQRHDSVPWRQLLRNRNLWAIMAMYHAYCWGAYFYVSWMPTYLRLGRGFTADEMQYYAMAPFVAGALGNLLGGVSSDALTRRYGLRTGRRAVGAIGLAVSALCLFGTATTSNGLVAVALLTFGYFAMDCMLPVSWSVCVDVGGKHSGAVTGAMNMAGQFGSFLSSIVFGWIVVASGGRYDLPLLLFSVMLGLSAVLFLVVDPTRPVVLDDMHQGPAQTDA